jgi:hypothetical protein
VKKVLIGGAAAAVLLVAAVWVGFDLFLVEKVDPKPPEREPAPATAPTFPAAPADVPPEITAFFAAFAADVRAGESARAADRFDPVKLYAVAAAGERTPDPPLPKLLGGQFSKLYSTVLESFGRAGFGLPWGRVEVRQVTEEKGDRLVDVRHIGGDHAVPVRWRLAESPKGLVAVDVEDLRTGLRLSHQFATLLGTGMDEARAAAAADAAKALRDATALITKGQPREADAVLGPAKRTPLTPAQNRAVLALEGLALAASNNPAKAETIAAALGDLPAVKLIRASVGELAKRLEAGKAYEAAFGPTPDTVGVRIEALMGEGKREAAADLLDASLKEFPDSPTLLAWATVVFT